MKEEFHGRIVDQGGGVEITLKFRGPVPHDPRTGNGPGVGVH